MSLGVGHTRRARLRGLVTLCALALGAFVGEGAAQAAAAEQLVPAHRIVHVTLVTRRGGAPVPDVRVFAVGGLDSDGRPDARRFWSEQVFSDARGVARFEFTRPATIDALVVDRGESTAPGWLPLEHPLDLDAPRDVPADFELELNPGATIWGHVVDLDDQPVPGARVHVATVLPYELTAPPRGTWPVDTSDTPSVVTDEAGRFELRGLGEYTHVVAVAPGLLALEALNGHLPEGSSVDGVLLRMAPPVELRGTLRTPDGAPAEDRFVMALPVDESRYDVSVPPGRQPPRDSGYLRGTSASGFASSDEHGAFALRVPAARLKLGATEYMMPVILSRTPEFDPEHLLIELLPGDEPLELYVPERTLFR